MLGKPPNYAALTPGGREVPVHIIEEEHVVSHYEGVPVSVPLADVSGTRLLAEIVKERVDRGRDCPVLVTGDRGAGKSTLILEIALTIDPDFDVDHIAFRLEDFNQIFSDNPQGDGKKGIYPQVILDEAGHALFAQDWMARAQKTVAKQLIISRIKRQIVWFAVPRRMQLNNQLRDMPYLWIHVAEPFEYTQGYAIAHISPYTPEAKWHLEKFWVPKLALIYPSLSGSFWNQYEARKIDFVNEVTLETASGRAGDQVSDAFTELVLHCLNDHKESYRDLEAVVHKKMTFQSMQERVKKYHPL
jgi:hypothetical protein